jgi:hypothetical protein
MRRSRPPPALAAGGLVLVLLVAITSWLTLERAETALSTPPAPSALSAPSTPIRTPTRTPVSRPSRAVLPPPAATPAAPRRDVEPQRTALQRATGLRADGTAVRVPNRGSGKFVTAERRARTTAKRGRLVRFDVAVEKGLAIDPDQAALLIAGVLDDERSWRGLGRGRFTLVPAGASADVRAYIATPRTTDRLCAPYRTLGKVSCQNGRRVVLNARRWVTGSKTFGDDISGYRRYLVNHEFGHVLGRRHVSCPGRGEPAPVMVQQTKGLGGCRPNPWPRRTRG